MMKRRLNKGRRAGGDRAEGVLCIARAFCKSGASATQAVRDSAGEAAPTRPDLSVVLRARAHALAFSLHALHGLGG